MNWKHYFYWHNFTYSLDIPTPDFFFLNTWLLQKLRRCKVVDCKWVELAWDGSVTNKATQSSSWQTQCSRGCSSKYIVIYIFIIIIILKNLRNPTSSKRWKLELELKKQIYPNISQIRQEIEMAELVQKLCQCKVVDCKWVELAWDGSVTNKDTQSNNLISLLIKYESTPYTYNLRRIHFKYLSNGLDKEV